MAAGRQLPPTPRRATPGWWLRRAFVAVLLGLVIAVVVDVARGGVTGTWLRYGSALVYLPRGERVEIAAGRSLYIDCRGEGSPTLVLEAGMGSDSATWSAVHDRLAEMTRTCAYDRTGRGRSDGGSAGDLAGLSVEVSALLELAGESPPYVVVGHSLGTVIGRVHASLHRDEVAGLVLVDGFDPDLFDAYVVPLTESHREGYLGHTAKLWSLVASVEGIDVERSRAQLAASDVAGMPIEVVIAARYEAGLSDAANQRIAASTRDGYASLSPGRVTVTIAYFSGHMVQFDRPDLVIEAAARIIEDVRAGS
ncbi:MAG: alpha/beta fold hydrolase [Chloroflexi bacterium]|nr:alpha/beta fold hydrolase [Chloroflexota bacterium]